MRIDLYTKVILTVITLSLSVIAFKDIIPIQKAYAVSKSQYANLSYDSRVILDELITLIDDTRYLIVKYCK